MTKKDTFFNIIIILIMFFSLTDYFYVAKDKVARGFSSNQPELYNDNVNTLEEFNTPETTGGKIGEIRVPIFVYHSVSPDYYSRPENQRIFYVEPHIFEKQMQYLKENNYTVISFNDLINHFSNNLPLPKKSAVITFDDGWKNQYQYAFPILKKYNYTATFFIFTNAIGHENFLTWPQIKELMIAGMTIGNHSKSHPYLYKITDDSELFQELIVSKRKLEDNLGKEVDIFAYPYGRYNQKIIQMLKENGFRAARTYGYNGVFHTFNDLFTLKTINAENDLINFSEALNSI